MDGDHDLTRFVEITKKLLDDNPLMNEPNTKQKVITPLLELLGWDKNFDLFLEFPIRIGSKTVKVDYALLIEGKPVVLIEAKGFDSEIGDNEAAQAISYGRIEGIRWAAVTNGKSIHLFNTEWGKNASDCLIACIGVDEYLERKKTLWLISKQSVLSQEIDQAATRVRQTREFINILTQEKEDLIRDIAEVFKKYGGRNLTTRITQISEEILSEMISRLRQDPQELVTSYDSKPESSSDDIKVISRAELAGDSSEEIAVFPSHVDGIEFMKKYHAWGFVKISRQPKYLDLYISQPMSKVLYVGEIDYITKSIHSINEIINIDDVDKKDFTPGKKIIYLKKGSIVKLSDPIPCESINSVPYSLRYTSLKKFKSAKNTGNL